MVLYFNLRNSFSENKSHYSESKTFKYKSDQQSVSVTDEYDQKTLDEESLFSKDEFSDKDGLSDKDDSTVSDDETNSVITSNGVFDFEYLLDVQKKTENGIETIYLPPLTSSLFTNVPPTIKFVTLDENCMLINQY